jgi:DNA-binding response OmpR family regulator
VLIVEDDDHLRRLVGYQLAEEGHDTTAVATVREAVTALDRMAPDIVLLDLGLPDGTGSDVLEALQARRSTAHVIVLSGAGAEDDRIGALKSGADDYLVKPFSLMEVAARIAAVERRRGPGRGRLIFDTLVIDTDARRVERDGADVEVTAREFDLLAFLASRPGQAFTRDELLRSVWDSSAEWQQEKTVTEHMRRLRAKIERDPAQPEVLQTVRGIGYRFEPPT